MRNATALRAIPLLGARALAAASVSFVVLVGPAVSRAVEPGGLDRRSPADSTPGWGGVGARLVAQGFRPLRGGQVYAKALATLDRYVRAGLIDPRGSLGELQRGELGLFHPIAKSDLQPEMRRKLEEAFSLALSRLRSQSECGRLFEPLGTDGSVMLATTIYLDAGPDEARAVCSGASAVAFTKVGWQTTYLCPQFARQSRWDGAVALLHESLHYAGLSERPLDPNGFSSRQISLLVRAQCGL